MNNRAFSCFQIKAIDEEKREITGIATTISADRSQDVVLSKGAKFKLPIPFLFQHDHDEPIGEVIEATVRDKQIEVVVRIAKIDEPGKLKDRIDEAWQSIKYKLVKGLSIGFNPLKWSDIAGTWGVEYTEWEWLELSAVTIAANQDASIRTIKSIYNKESGASANKSLKVVNVKTSGVSDKSKLKSGVTEMKTYAEKLKAFEDTLEVKNSRMAELLNTSSEAGRTFDEAEAEEFDTLEAETKSLNDQIERLKRFEKSNVASAQAVVDKSKGVTTSAVRHSVTAKNTQKLEPGLAFARAAKCLALGHLEHRDAIQIAKSLYDGQEDIINATHFLVTKAAVAPATTTDSTWAAPLIGNVGGVFADFVEYLRPQTILGRFGQNGVPSLRRVPFRVPLVGQTSGGDGYWVGEGQAKPLTKFDFSRTTLQPLKVANIAVATMEVVRDSSPSADFIIRDQLAAALRERLDIDFIDPAKAASAGVSPASVLNGAVAIASSGTDADAVRADIRALFGVFIAANNAPTSGVWIMSATTALSLSLMQNPLGQAEFPGLGMMGGNLMGLPVIVSEYVPSETAGSIVALVNASDIYLGDEGGIDLSMSTEASLQMDNAPDNPTTASTVLVSLWQRNLVGFRAERTINWARRRTSAVAYLTGVNWGG